MSDDSLGGKVAVVTGANRGIGRAIALRLAAKGAAVVLGARDTGKLDEAAQVIEAAGGMAAPFAVDLRDPDGPVRLVEFARERMGGLDILVNNAGDTKFGPFLDLTDADFESGFGLKYYAALRASRAAWPLLAARKGVIVNIVGIGGRVPGPEFAIGASVNAAVMALTKSLAAFGVDQGVRVCAVNPGSVATDRLNSSVAAWAEKSGTTPEAMVDKLIADQKVLRLGKPEDIAAIVAFLASPAASWITGSLIDVDGGAVKAI